MACRAPDFAGDTNADLVDYAIDLKEALALCNSDKEALRQWRASNEERAD